jgi:branched-subunit amino acid transport protein
MRSHIAVGALVLAALAFITAALIAALLIAAVFTVARPYAVEWRWASALLPSVPLPTELTEVQAADILPTRLATRACTRKRAVSALDDKVDAH